MDPELIGQLADHLGISEEVLTNNIVGVVTEVNQRGGSVEEAAKALDDYMSSLYKEFSQCGDPEDHEDPYHMCDPMVVDVPEGHPKIRDVNHETPIPPVFYAVVKGEECKDVLKVLTGSVTVPSASYWDEHKRANLVGVKSKGILKKPEGKEELVEFRKYRHQVSMLESEEIDLPEGVG